MTTETPDTAPATLDGDSQAFTAAQARALVQLLETAPQVQRRHHFFVWLQTQVHALLPHVLAVCGSYQRQQRALQFECFYSVVLPPQVLQSCSDGGSALMARLSQAWVEGRGQALRFVFDEAGTDTLGSDTAALRQAGLGCLCVHGVARPQRPDEIESLFVLAGPVSGIGSMSPLHLDLLLPHLHATYLRVQSIERAMSVAPRPGALPANRARRPQITARERQVLVGVREGKNNQQISEALGISALTVKNHIQKILRKLGAQNRAQAVAMTMSLGGLAACDDGADASPTPP